MCVLSKLDKIRSEAAPALPKILRAITQLTFDEKKKLALDPRCSDQLKALFPHAPAPALLNLTKVSGLTHNPLKVGCVLSGGQAAGGHNVIVGLFDALKKLHSGSTLIGFLDGPAGILKGRYLPLTKESIAPFYNRGGFHMIGSGRDKIEGDEQLALAMHSVQELELDGLVVIGGDDSNTNAAILAEYFATNNCSTKVLGVPKTIDGDLKSDVIEASFGFDTAAKTFSAAIGSLLCDSISAKKYTFFIKLMGRSASHVALECALQTHPNYTIISEEIAATGKTFNDVVCEIADLIDERSQEGKNYGTILIPEGAIEFFRDFKEMIGELNLSCDADSLHTKSKEVFQQLPKLIQKQLLMDRDPHGNVQVTKIETERLFIHAVEKELKKRGFTGKFSPQPLSFGYEGRSCSPSPFDSDYCYLLGHVAALLIDAGITSHMCAVQNLTAPVDEWKPAAVSLISMMSMEERKGEVKPVIKKTLVDLKGYPFRAFADQRKKWRLEDNYINPGPIQFYGPEDLIRQRTKTLLLEQAKELSYC